MYVYNNKNKVIITNNHFIMKTYNISCEIQLDANNPLDAAKKFQNWLKEQGENFAFYVQQDGKDEIYSVDLDESETDATVLIYDYTPVIQL